MFISALQLSDSVMYVHSFLYSCPLWFIPGYWILLPVLYSQTRLSDWTTIQWGQVVDPLYSSLRLPTPNSQPIRSPRLPPWQPQACSLRLTLFLTVFPWNVSTFFWSLIFFASLCQQGALYSCLQASPLSLEIFFCLLRGLSLPILKLANVVTNHITLALRVQRPWCLVC